jgi:hypothetical protein
MAHVVVRSSTSESASFGREGGRLSYGIPTKLVSHIQAGVSRNSHARQLPLPPAINLSVLIAKPVGFRSVFKK